MNNSLSRPAKRQTTLLTVVVFICFSLIVLYTLTPKLAIGLRLAPFASGTVYSQTFYPDGTSQYALSQSTKEGYVSFLIPSSCSHFNFVFTPQTEPYKLHALTLFGIPIFTAQFLYEHLRTTLPLYRTDFLPRGSPLELTITPNHRILDYYRFLDVLLMLFRLYRLGLLLLIIGIIFCVAILILLQKKPYLLCHLQHVQIAFLRLSKNRMFFLISLSIIGLLSLPAPAAAVEAGLDASWMWLLNQLALTPVFGAKTVFTYGPLGFVLFPQLPLLNVWVALSFNIAYLGLWWSLLFFLFSQPQIAKLPLWCFLFCAFIPLKTREWEWIMLAVSFCATLAFHPALTPRCCIYLSCIITLLGVSITLMKISGIFVIASTYILALLYLMAHDLKQMMRSVIASSITLILGLSLARFLLFPSWNVFTIWIQDSFLIASGYNLCMLLNKPWGQLLMPFVYIAATASFLLFRKPKGQLLYQVVFFLPLVFCLTKYAIIRQNSDPMLYAGVWGCAILATFAKVNDRLRCLQAYGSLLTLALLLSYIFSLSGLSTYPTPYGLSFKHLHDTVHLRKTIESIRFQSVENLKGSHFPETWRARIAQYPTLVLPFDFSGLAADQLNTMPFYSFQGYSAYTHTLDQKSARKLTGADSPNFIICEFATIDNRNLFLESPSVWTTIRCNYRLIDCTSRWLLLQRTTPISVFPVPTQEHLFPVGQWIYTDTTTNTFMVAQWAQTPLGVFLSTFLRNDMTFLTLEHEDGSQVRYRIQPDTLQSGFLIHQIPRHLEDLKSIFSMQPNSAMRVKRFKFDSNHGFYYKDTIKLYF